jgi:16S rRNA (guanine527-N7)-methyltransferase
MDINITACQQQLLEGLEELNVDINTRQLADLLSYLESFHKWNKAINLSSIRNPTEIITRHLLDSLVLVPYFKKHLEKHKRYMDDKPLRLIDVGTGGGLPGMPLAIYFPNMQVTLLDSSAKKTHFLFQTALKLGLSNITIENRRVESFNPNENFDIVISRAFASLSDMLLGTEHLLVDKGQYWAMKGVYPRAELQSCANKVDILDSHRLKIPKCNKERHLVVLTPKEVKNKA